MGWLSNAKNTPFSLMVAVTERKINSFESFFFLQILLQPKPNHFQVLMRISFKVEDE